MPPRDRLEHELAAIKAARTEPGSPASRSTLEKALASKSSFAVAAAAEAVGEVPIVELGDAVAAALDRFLAGGDDPGCGAKLALATALDRVERIGSRDVERFLAGIALVQREPVYGGSVDTAAALRGTCALALARTGHAAGFDAIVRLLVDPDWVARLHAARALGASGRLEGAAVLEFKALAGDPEPQVMTECFSALLAITPERGLAFVARFLDEQAASGPRSMHAVQSTDSVTGSPCTCCGKARHAILDEDSDPRRDAAALAIGQSRAEGAFEILKRHAERRHAGERRVPLLAIAMVRSRAALDYLCAFVEDGEGDEATAAIAALAMYRYDEALRERVDAAVKARKSVVVKRAFEAAFNDP